MKILVPNICCLQVTHCKYKDTNRKEVKSWKNIYGVNTNQKKIRVVMLIPKLIPEQKILAGMVRVIP